MLLKRKLFFKLHDLRDIALPPTEERILKDADGARSSRMKKKATWLIKNKGKEMRHSYELYNTSRDYLMTMSK